MSNPVPFYCEGLAEKRLTAQGFAGEVTVMMKNRALLAAAPLAALLALGACKQQTINGNDDPQAEALNNAAPVEAPPMIQASRTYRCKDNSLLYADFYTNDTVQVHAKKDDPGTTLTAAAAGQPYTAEGYSLSANAAQISYTSPGRGTQSCKA